MRGLVVISFCPNMKNFITIYNRIGTVLLLLYVFTVPFQFYLTSGFSITLSLILITLLTLYILIAVIQKFKDSGFLSIYQAYKGYLILPLIFLPIVVSYFFNTDTSSVKELLRWGLFLSEIFIAIEVVRITKIPILWIVNTFILSTFAMILLTFYQITVSQEVEYSIMKSWFGNIFNDPELISTKLTGESKFNWIYGNTIRVHGVFANVSHFAFLLGASLILLIETYRSKWDLKLSILGGILASFIILSLVRSVQTAILVVVFVNIIIAFVSKDWKCIMPYLYTQILGVMFAIVLALLSYEKIFLYTLAVRFVETITFDGAIFNSYFTSFKSFFSRINVVPTDEFNEYGGVGGRYNLWKITLLEVIIPRIKNLQFLLFGLGPSSLGVTLKSTLNEYFKLFNTVDNSYLQWFVEIGLMPFLILGAYLKKHFKFSLRLIQEHWQIIIFVGISALFTNILPDIRMGMILSILILIVMMKHGK